MIMDTKHSVTVSQKFHAKLKASFEFLEKGYLMVMCHALTRWLGSSENLFHSKRGQLSTTNMEFCKK